MKSKLMTYYCMEKECDWEETTHKIRDGIKCPQCNGPVMSINPIHHKSKQEAKGGINCDC